MSIRPSILLLLLLASGCGTKWTDVRTPNARFEVREVDDLADPFARAVHAGSARPVAADACADVELKTEEIPRHGGRQVTYAWADNRASVERCAGSVSKLGMKLAIDKGGVGFRTYTLGAVAILSGADLVRGRLHERDDLLLLQLEITPAAARRLSDFTSSHVGRRMAIVIDGDVESAPIIAGPISSPSIYLTVRDGAAGQDLLRRLTGP